MWRVSRGGAHGGCRGPGRSPWWSPGPASGATPSLAPTPPPPELAGPARPPCLRGHAEAAVHHVSSAQSPRLRLCSCSLVQGPRLQQQAHPPDPGDCASPSAGRKGPAQGALAAAADCASPAVLLAWLRCLLPAAAQQPWLVAPHSSIFLLQNSSVPHARFALTRSQAKLVCAECGIVTAIS